MNETVSLQRAARQAWRRGRFAEAAKLYREAAETCSGFARQVNLKCARDCEQQKPFNGTPEEAR